MNPAWVAALSLATFAIGALTGHAAGYYNGKRVGRQQATLTRISQIGRGAAYRESKYF